MASTPAPTYTVRDLIEQAHRDVGILGTGQTLASEDANNAFIRLNWMIGQWNRKRWLIYHLLDLSSVSYGADYYTIGPKGDFQMSSRPDKIEAAYYRQVTLSFPNQPDNPIEILQSREDYSLICLKQLQSVPSYLFYDADFPTGKLYFWPIPLSGQYEMHVLVKAVLTSYSNLSDPVNLPDEYHAALFYNLVVRLYPVFNKAPRPDVIALARDALNVIRESNFSVPRLRMPDQLSYPGIYNPYSDRVR